VLVLLLKRLLQSRTFIIPIVSSAILVTCLAALALGQTPSTTTNLSALTGTYEGEIQLTWTAPGNDGMTGTASHYSIRYSTDVDFQWEIDWEDATIWRDTTTVARYVSGEFGTQEQELVTGLTSGTTYYFHLKTASTSYEWSELSNGATAFTQYDLVQPAKASDLTADNTDIRQGEIKLSWTAPGDDGTIGLATGYQIRYSTTSSESPAISIAAFASAESVSVFSPIPSPAAPSNSQNFTITGLTPGVTYYFALRTFDNVNNLADLSPGATEWAQYNYPPYTPLAPKCEGKDNPQNVDDKNPTFSWSFNDPNSGDEQSACQLEVGTSSGPFTADVWESGKTSQSEKSMDYGGPTLKAESTYYWRAMLWDNHDSSSPWTAVQNFKTNFFFVKSTSTEADYTRSVAVGDIDGDGDLDVICGNDGPSSRVYENDGVGNLTLKSSIGGGPEDDETFGLSLVDVDGDGDLDLIVVRHETNAVDHMIYKNDGGGNFTQYDSFGKISSVADMSLATGDLDNDGDVDFIAARRNQECRIYLNDGDGNYTYSGDVDGSSYNTYSVALADFDNDRDLDLIMTNNSENRYYRNNGDATFTYWGQTNETNDSRVVAVGDLDSDGKLDFAIGNADCNVQVYRNTGSSFTLTSEVDNSTGCLSLAVGDVDNDGDLDILIGIAEVVVQRTNILAVNDGNGNFTQRIVSRYQGATKSLGLLDIDADGDLDYYSGDGQSPYPPNVLFESYKADDPSLHPNPIKNLPPSPPDSGFGFTYEGSTLTLYWGIGSDVITDDNRLCYNIRMSTYFDAGQAGNNVVSGALGTTQGQTGQRWGNVGISTWTYLILPKKTYFWQVQAIDGGLAAGNWSAVQTINELPHGGWDSDDVLVSTCCAQSTDGQGLVTVNFRLRDPDENLCRLSSFYYSLDDGQNWKLVASTACFTNGAGWMDNNGSYYASSTTWSGPGYAFAWDTKDSENPDYNTLKSTYSASTKVRFLVHDRAGDYELSTSTWVVSNAFIIDNEKPNTPSALTALEPILSDRITLAWSPSQDGSTVTYEVVYDDESMQWPNIPPYSHWVVGTDTTTTVAGLSEDTPYYFVVYATDTYGNVCDDPAIPANELMARTNDAPDVTVTSANQRSDASGLVDIQFIFDDVNDSSWNYVVSSCTYYDPTMADWYVMTASATDASHTVNPSTGVTNTFVWNATSNVGAGYFSGYNTMKVQIQIADSVEAGSANQSTGFTLDTDPPGKPEGFHGITATGISITWGWTASTDTTLQPYELYYSSAGPDSVVVRSSETATLKYVSSSDTSTIVTDLLPLTTYWARIWAVDSGGFTAYSDTASYCTTGEPMASFADIPAEQINGSGLVASTVTVIHAAGLPCSMKIEFATAAITGPWHQSWIDTTTYIPGILIDNTSTYQIQNITGTDPPGTDIWFFWDTKHNGLDGFEDADAWLRITAYDGNIEQSGPSTSTVFAIDNCKPQFLSGTYSYDTGVLEIIFDERMKKSIAPDDGVRISTTSGTGGFELTSSEYPGEWLNWQSSATFSCVLSTAHKRDITIWDGNGASNLYVTILSSAFPAYDVYGNQFSVDISSTITWLKDETQPCLSSATYQGEPHLLTLWFNKEMRADSLTPASAGGIQLQNSTQTPTGTVSLMGATTSGNVDGFEMKLILTPAQHSTIVSWGCTDYIYLAIISTAVISDLSGNGVALISENSALQVLTTGDYGKPYILTNTFVPLPDTLGAPINQNVIVQFSEAMSETETLAALKVAAIRDEDGKEIYSVVTGTKQLVNGTTAIFIPQPGLKYNHLYRVTVSDNARDISQNRLQFPVQWEFTTLMNHAENNVVCVPSQGVTLELPAGSLSENGYIKVSTGPAAPAVQQATDKVLALDDPYHFPLVPTLISVYNAGGNRLSDSFGKEVTIKIGYPDADQDGIVDETDPAIRERTLSLYTLEGEIWMKVQGCKVSTEENLVSATVWRAGAYTIMGGPEYELNNAHVYPVPYNAQEDKNRYHQGITFVGLASECDIYVYDITGRLVKHIVHDDGDYYEKWEDITNENGEQLASGVYFFLVKSKGYHQTGKLVIIR